MHEAHFEKTFETWREEARKFLRKDIPPAAINWAPESPNLFSLVSETNFIQASPSSEMDSPQPSAISFGTSKPAAHSSGSSRASATSTPIFKVPAEFLSLAENLACARDLDRWDLLYRILFRLKENPHLLKISVDPDIHRAQLLLKSVRRDIHKMHAFVRFKKTTLADQEAYIAWHRPEHPILRLGAPFFVRRFGDKPWSIFTPDESAHWDLKELTFSKGMHQNDFNTRDDWDEVWKIYYKSIFNPARIKIKAMKLEMAPKYWSTLPEASLIPELVRQSSHRLQTMALNHNQAAIVLPHANLDELGNLAGKCTSCPLHERATQTVFGSGFAHAKLMIIGEQPGDQEDQTGKAFVGPAGEVLMESLRLAGISRDEIYITNAVKHFKWTEQGKARIHKKPSGSEMHACKPWLEAEIAQVKPNIILALGATAATAILGRLPKISEERGQVIAGYRGAPGVVISWHPSAILRSSPEDAKLLRNELLKDLSLAFLESLK